MSNPYNIQRRPTFNTEYKGEFCISTISLSGWLGVDSFSENKRQIAMQYTGLKDKNDVEIYEGDIINVFDYDTEFLGYGKIVFDNFSWSIEWICKTTSFTMMFSEWYEETKTVKVIGNIYEHSHLLDNN